MCRVVHLLKCSYVIRPARTQAYFFVHLLLVYLHCLLRSIHLILWLYRAFTGDTFHVCIITLNLFSELSSCSQLFPWHLMSQKHLKFQRSRVKLFISLNDLHLYSFSITVSNYHYHPSSYLCGQAGN